MPAAKVGRRALSKTAGGLPPPFLKGGGAYAEENHHLCSNFHTYVLNSFAKCKITALSTKRTAAIL